MLTHTHSDSHSHTQLGTQAHTHTHQHTPAHIVKNKVNCKLVIDHNTLVNNNDQSIIIMEADRRFYTQKL